MSEQKWAVLSTEAMNGWLVAHPGDVFRVLDGRLECWEVHSRHDTWTEAIQEADRMARTITVTLPRDPDAREVARAGEWASWKGNGWAITSNDPERAALALLAHARKETP